MEGEIPAKKTSGRGASPFPVFVALRNIRLTNRAWRRQCQVDVMGQDL